MDASQQREAEAQRLLRKTKAAAEEALAGRSSSAAQNTNVSPVPGSDSAEVIEEGSSSLIVPR